MPRPQRCRRICTEPSVSCFSPEQPADGEAIVLSLDEYEVIRLVDFEKLTHEACAKQMEISRTTVTEIYETARYKLADSIVNGKRLRIAGGNYRICDGSASCPRANCCKRANACSEKNEAERGTEIMKIAVTYACGQIFQHFGHSEQFKLYTIENGKVTASEVVGTNGSGHGALANFLAANAVDTLICGGIGGGAQSALAAAGIRLYGGVSGDADEAVEALLRGKLAYNPEVRCSHHDQENGGTHTCGEHGCGSHSCHES